MEEPMEQMKLRVKPTVQIPHTVLVRSEKAGGKIPVSFAPDAEVDQKTGEALLKTYPHVFEPAKGPYDLKKYTIKKSVQEHNVVELFAKLSEEDQLEFLEALKDRVEEAAKEKAKAAEEEKESKIPPQKSLKEELEAMTIAELEKHAKKNKLEFPEGCERKAQMVDFLVKNIKLETADAPPEE